MHVRGNIFRAKIVWLKRGRVFKVKKPTLLMIAALLWLTGSIMVLKSGLAAAVFGYNILSFVVSLSIFTAFHIFIFGRLVKRHTLRIMASDEERLFILNFFDKKSWFMMIFMSLMGAALRNFELIPQWWIAAIYMGIGSALLVGGLHFVLYYSRILRNGTHQRTRTVL